MIIGNPPYGRGSNLAIEFINTAKRFADKIIMVVPLTLRKSTTMNKIDANLHLTSDVDNDPKAFGFELYTCNQTWEVRQEERVMEKIYNKEMVKDDFLFTSKEDADVTICAIGRYQIGQVFYRGEDYGHLKNFQERSEGSHHFLKILRPEALETLSKLKYEFQEAASFTVAQSALSINDLVRVYLGAK